MNFIAKLAYQPYKWFIAIPMIFLLTMVLCSTCIITGLLFGQDAANHVAVLWAKLCCAVVPIRVKIIGTRNYDRKQAYVIVSNHQSMIDIPAIHARLGLNIKWIMKKELRSIPVFGAACHYLGCISIDRADNAAAIQSIQSAKERLSRTASPLFFAEGTRSRDGRVMPFKKGAFKFACDTGLPVLPVTVKNAAKLLPSHSLDLIPGTVELIIHPPVHPSQYPKDRLDQFIADTRQIICNSLQG